MAENYAIMPLQDYAAVCDAIREKTGGTDPITSGEMAAQIQGITGGNDEADRWLFTGTDAPEEYVYHGETLRDYALYHARKAGEIGCYPTQIRLPSVVTIPQYCFANPVRASNYLTVRGGPLETVSAPLAETVDKYAFEYAEITSISAPNITIIRDYAFSRCAWLESVNFPLLKMLGTGSMQYCDRLKCLELPAATSINGCGYCNALVYADLPAATALAHGAFQRCSSLCIVDIGRQCSIANQAFAGTSSAPVPLSAVILRSADAISTLAATGAFSGSYVSTSIDDGYIYAPSDLLGDYQTATNWSTYASKLRALEDWPKISDWKNWESDPIGFASLADYLIYYGKEENK